KTTPTKTPAVSTKQTSPPLSPANAPPVLVPQTIAAANPEPILTALPADAPITSPLNTPDANQCALTALAEAAASPRGRAQSRRRNSGPWVLAGLFVFVVLMAGALVAAILASRTGWLTSYGPLPSQRETAPPSDKDAPVTPSGVIAFPRRALVI